MTRLLLSAIAALTVFSCEEESSSKSYITSFEKYEITTSASPVTIDEAVIDDDADTVSFVFVTNDKQISEVHLTVDLGSSTTATEGVDFDLLTHDVELLAYEGQDGFIIPIVVYEDYEPGEEDEEIYLTFTSTDPSGVEVTETKVVTIKDSGLTQPLEIAMSWDSEFEFGGESYTLCDFLDLDFYLYDEDGDEVTGYSGATGDCPETFSLGADAPDGVYEIWVNFWDRYAFEDELCEDEFGNLYECLGPFEVPVSITFTRGDNEKVIEYASLTGTNSPVWYRVDGVDTNPYEEYYVATIEVSDGVFSFYDIDGESAGSLRKRTKETSQHEKERRHWPSIK